MASLYDIMEEMKTLFEANGYTAYDITEFDHQKVSKVKDSKFPLVFIGRQLETIDNEASPLHFLKGEAGIDVNVVLNTGEKKLYEDGATNIRKIKDIIYTNRCNPNWDDWVMVDNFIAQLQSSNTHSKAFGGININTTVMYRENEIEGVL